MGEISKLAPPEGWHFPGLKGEVKRGSLVELLGNDRQEWLTDLFLAYPETRLAWVAPKLKVFPTALAQRGVKLSRCLFLETERELTWSLMQVLRSGLFSFVMAPIEVIPASRADAFLRKLQILAERSYSTLFFLSDQPTAAFSLSYRIEVNRTHSQLEASPKTRRVFSTGTRSRPGYALPQEMKAELLSDRSRERRSTTEMKPENESSRREVKVLKQKKGALAGS